MTKKDRRNQIFMTTNSDPHLLRLPRHEAVEEGNLFAAVARTHEAVDGEQLVAGVPNQLEGTVHIPVRACSLVGVEAGSRWPSRCSALHRSSSWPGRRWKGRIQGLARSGDPSALQGVSSADGG